MHSIPVSPTCAYLLERASVYHPVYGDRLSNHLPMALIALDRLGADAQHLHAFFDHYGRRLVPRQPLSMIGNPLQSLGEPRQFEVVLNYFEQQLATRNREHVLHTWLPILIPGVGASAFHPLIRLAYALDANHGPGIAVALASWTTEYRALGAWGEATMRTLDEIVQLALPAVAGRDLGPGIIIDKMVNASATVAAMGIASQPATLALEDIVAFALHAYHAREDFTLLHLVTASHALRLVLPHVPEQDREAGLRHFWHAVLLAYLTVAHSSAVAPARKETAADAWRRCLRRASMSFDDHVAKLTYTAWQEAEFYRDPRYLSVALRKNGIRD